VGPGSSGKSAHIERHSYATACRDWPLDDDAGPAVADRKSGCAFQEFFFLFGPAYGGREQKTKPVFFPPLGYKIRAWAHNVSSMRYLPALRVREERPTWVH
jgi:hypothetical protein